MKINIHSIGIQLDLKEGKYWVDIVGGWGVKLGDFSMVLKNYETEEPIACKPAFWRAQSVMHGQRAKRAFTFEVVVSGTYVVEFKNPRALVVKPSNLFFASFFEDPIANSDIEVFIH